MNHRHEVADLERLNAALEGRYVLSRVLGRGGMATVYLGRDVRHDRQVAVKVLDRALAARVGTERFLKEIGTAARLAHPNIVPMYDSGAADGTLYYVMPHLTGETLRQVIARERRLGLGPALDITRAISEALDYAHRHGVIHRDVKPENILLHEGQPMVLDFGIALAVSDAEDHRLTATGMSPGTPTYMSPEQVTGDGRPDARTDVYALGALLYEMLSGDPPFEASNVHALIAKIVADPPTRLDLVRPDAPAHVSDAVHRALAKVPADRFESARALASALASDQAAAPGRRVQLGRWLGAAAVIAVVALGARKLIDSSEPSPLGNAQTTTRPLTSFPGFEASASWAPGGAQFTYMHVNRSSSDLFVLAPGGVPRALSEHQADELTPRWSPDGSRIAYVADYGSGSALYWIPPSGGAPRRIVDLGIPLLERTMTGFLALGSNPWSPSGDEVVVSRMDARGGMSLWKVHVTTGEILPLTHPAPGDDDLGATWSFDGRRIAFARMRGGIGRLMVVPAGGGDPAPVLDEGGSDFAPAWMPDDERLVFMSARAGALNLWQVHLRSSAIRRVTSSPTFDYLPSVNRESGEIAYVQFSHQTDVHRLDLTRAAASHRRITAHSFDNFGARVSRDGRFFVYFSNRTGSYEIWRHDLESGSEIQLTADPANDFLPDFSPDGRSIAFFSDRDGIYQLWVMDHEGRAIRRVTDHAIPLAGGGPVDVHFGGPRWSPDGSLIGYVAPTDSALNLWVVAPDGTGLRATELAGVLTFDWFMDSQRVLYTRAGATGGVELLAADLETGEEVVLLRGPVAEVTVSPSGNAVAHLLSPSHFTMDLHLLRLEPPRTPGGLPRASGEPRQVTFGNGDWHAHNGSWFPDGRSILYSRDTDRGDLFAVRITEG